MNLIELMEGPIRALATRYLNRYKDGDFDDLCQIGRMAVLAIGTGGANNFDSKRATSSFQVWVAYRVKLAMLDALRLNSGGIIRVPRQSTTRFNTDVKRAKRINSIDVSEDSKYNFNDIIERRELIEIVHKIIDKMPANWAEVMRRRLRGEEFKKIGEELGFSTSNAFQLSQKAHKWFAMLIRESYDNNI